MIKCYLCVLLICSTLINAAYSQPAKPFKVLAFYTAKEDLAHISFVHEANKWFDSIAGKYHFYYDSTNDWNKLNTDTLAQYKVIIFLDTRTEDSTQRIAFKTYMKHGGAWMGFHFSAFALTPSDFNADWNWYHNEFLGSGQYVSNTWHPTSAYLKVKDVNHPATKGLPHIIKAAPNEWYRWQYDLRKNPDIDILLAIDSSSFPLGNGPQANRDMAQWLLSGCMDEQKI